MPLTLMPTNSLASVRHPPSLSTAWVVLVKAFNVSLFAAQIIALAIYALGSFVDDAFHTVDFGMQWHGCLLQSYHLVVI